MLRQHLKNTKIADGCTDKQLSAMISRHPGLDIPRAVRPSFSRLFYVNGSDGF
jgi:hypothetical protein